MKSIQNMRMLIELRTALENTALLNKLVAAAPGFLPNMVRRSRTPLITLVETSEKYLVSFF